MDKVVENALAECWDCTAALAGWQHWQAICKAENWCLSAEQTDGVIRVFGASWYFTRFIYYRGIKIISLFDLEQDYPESLEKILRQIEEVKPSSTEEDLLEHFRLNKNEAMLLVLVQYLRGRIGYADMEVALTQIADIVIANLFKHVVLRGHDNKDVLVLGMGNLAGFEMNFGSDLDMIFLSKKRHSDLSQYILRLLRVVNRQSAAGILYEIDTRLRPYGNSGILLSTVDDFLDFHRGEREIWERQIMTRCRPIYGEEGMAEEVTNSLDSFTYQNYPSDTLAKEIYNMRLRVEKELGKSLGRYDIKRGTGGIMDIHFLAHYFQLLYGVKNPELRVRSTRAVLNQLSQFIDPGQLNVLNQGYAYLTQLQCTLRVKDMKSISTFSSSDAKAWLPLARSLALTGADMKDVKVEDFLTGYRGTTEAIRSCFDAILNV